MADTVETDYPLNFRDKKALLARKVEVRSFLVEEPTWSSPVDLPSGIRQSVVFANPFKQNVHELAYLEPDGTLVYLERSPDSTTGWSKSVIPGRYTQVVSTIHPDGSVWLFALGTPPGLVQQMHGFLLDEEGWASLYSVGLSGAAQIYAGLGPDGGPRISGSGSVPHNGSAAWELAPVSTGNGWEPKPLQFGAQPNAVDWVAGYDRWGHQKTYSLVPNASGRGMQLVISYEPGTRTVTDDVMSLAGPSVTQVDGLAVLDGVYYLTRGNTLAVGYALAGEVWPIPTPGHVWAQASAHSDDQGQVIFVGLQAGDVRVARQTGSEPSLWQYTVPTFEPFGPTTAGMTFTIATGGGSQLAVDLSPTNRIAIATWGGTKSSRMHTHDLRFGWRDEPLRLPADISLANERLVTHYVADAYVRNGIGAPMQVVPVGLSADIPIQVEVQGQQVVLGPDATVSTFTDVFGKVTFRLPATALDTPLIHLSALGLGQGASVNLAECVQDFLGGDAAIAAVSEGLTAATLNQAQVHGQPLIPFSRAPIQAPPFVSQSHRAFARPGYESPPPPTGSGDPTSSRPQTSGSTHSTDPSQDDLLQSFRCGAVAVNGLSFDADTRAAIVWIPVAEGSFELPLNLDAAEYSARVLECLFRWCSASAADVLGWLTSTIDFAQMWNTVKAMEQMSVTLMDWQNAAATYFSAAIKPGVFNAAADQLTEGLVDARAQVGTRSVPQLLLQFEDESASGDQLPGLFGAVLDLTDLIDSPHGRWIFERALYSKAGPPPPDLPDTHDVVPVTQAILEVFGSGEDVRVFVDALPGLAAPWNVIDPADFSLDPADLGLALLDSVVAPALSSCEEASTSIAGALARSTGALTQVLAGPAGAGPELDAIFSWLQVRAGVASGDVVPLTALRLGLLVAAVPANVACQRALGAYPFSLGQAPAIPLPPSRSSQVRATNLEPEVEGFEPWTLTCMTVQVVAAAARLVCGWMNTVNDFKPLGLAGCDAPLFPAEGDARRTMSLFVAFETVSFVFNDCPVFRGCTMAEGWTASEEFFWWLQWIVQAMMILLDGVLVFFGHLVPESKRVVLALDGMMGARLRTTSSVVQLGLAGYTFGRSKGGRVDALRLLNRFAGCLPGMLGYLRYLVLDNLAGQPAPTKVLTGRPVVWLNAKVSTTIEADRIGPATRCWFVLSELLDPPSMPALTLPNGHLHQPYEQVSAFAPQGGTQPYSGWRVVHGRLPGGITLEPSEDGNTCVLAGTPKESGGFPFTLEVADHFAPEVTTKHTFSVYILSADEE